MYTVPTDVIITMKCGFCGNLPTRAPIYQRINDETLVCADCWSFVAFGNSTDTFARQTKLEILLPHIRTELATSPQSAVSVSSTNLFENFDPEPEALPLIRDNRFQNVRNDLSVNLTSKLKGNKTTKKATVLQYSMSVEKQTGSKQQLCLVDENYVNRAYRDVKPVELYIEGAISLNKNPQQVYGRVEVVPPRTSNIYETIPSGTGSLRISNTNLQPLQEQRTFCKNGCLWRGSTADISEHYKTCAMADITCWFERCGYQGPEQFIKGHLYNKHREHIKDSINGNFQQVHVDRLVIVIKSGIIFLFKYFYYEDLEFAELLVQAVVNKTDIDYIFTVSVFSDSESSNKVLTKSAKCLIYNKCVLQSGIKFEKQELQSLKNCMYTVDISAIL